MKTVVTGATGFLGSWLVEELVSQGYEVIAVGRDLSKMPTEWLSNNRIECVEYSVETLSKKCADLFFHLYLL